MQECEGVQCLAIRFAKAGTQPLWPKAFARQECSPSLVTDINHLARIQRLATRLVTGLRHLPYEDIMQRQDLERVHSLINLAGV